MASMTRSRAVRLVVPAALATLLVSGCSDGSPGTAAVVGSERLTVAEVQERTRAFLEAYPEATGSGVTSALVATVTVENFVRGAVVEAAAERAGIDVTPAEIDEFIEELGGIEEVTNRTSSRGVPPDPVLVRGEIRSALLQQALGEAAAGPNATDEEIDIATRAATDEMSAAIHVEVNPRYGTWDGSLVSESTGSLSLTEAELNSPTGGLEDPAAVVPQG